MHVLFTAPSIWIFCPIFYLIYIDSDTIRVIAKMAELTATAARGIEKAPRPAIWGLLYLGLLIGNVYNYYSTGFG